MIRLSKQPKPQVLVVNGVAWRDEYLAAQAAGGPIPNAIRYRYRHLDIKAALRLETAEKCAYCESKIAAISPEHIEHILAKVARPELIVEWTNLTLACPECNSRKGEYYSEVEPVINPYVDDPADHLFFCGPLVFGVATSPKGERTALLLDLSRPKLVERKIAKMKSLHHLVSRWQRETDPQLSSLLEEQVREEAKPDAEYAATIRQYLASQGFN